MAWFAHNNSCSRSSALLFCIAANACVINACVIKLDELSPAAKRAMSPPMAPGVVPVGDSDPSIQTPQPQPSEALSGEALPPGAWTNATANLAGMESECGDLVSIAAKPDEDRLIAGIAARGLAFSTNGGGSWQMLGTGSASDAIRNRPQTLLWDPSNPKQWWESGIYNGPGVFRTTDNGDTFKASGTLGHIDSIAIDFRDPERKLIIAGEHEAGHKIHRSLDGGATWSQIAESLVIEAGGCSWVDLIDAQTYLVGCDNFGEGIYRTIDGGTSWAVVSPIGGAGRPLHTQDGSIYWMRPDTLGLVRSTDDGQSWTAVTEAHVLRSVPPVELPDGRIAALGQRSVVVSSDRGATWKPVSAALPFADPSGFAYSPHRNAFFVKHAQCVFDKPDTVLEDAIMRFDFDN